MTCPRSLSPVFLGMCVALAALLTGCSSGSRTVSGLVLPGKAGVVTLVAANDPRLQEPGLGEVHLRLTRGGGTPASLAETTSNPDGSFSFRIAEGLFRHRIEVIATGPGVLTCRGAVYLPTDDRRLLVIVEPKGAVGVSTHGVSTHGAGERTR